MAIQEHPNEDRPPVFGSWKKWYIFLLVVLLIQIIVYYLLTLKYT
jgi:hypothetical protein